MLLSKRQPVLGDCSGLPIKPCVNKAKSKRAMHHPIRRVGLRQQSRREWEMGNRGVVTALEFDLTPWKAQGVYIVPRQTVSLGHRASIWWQL